jgi:hypothetical protein
MQLGVHTDAFFHSQLLEIGAAMDFCVTAWQKPSSLQTCLVFKPKNQSKSLLGPYEGKLQQLFCPPGRKFGDVGSRLVEKSSSLGFSSL